MSKPRAMQKILDLLTGRPGRLESIGDRRLNYFTSLIQKVLLFDRFDYSFPVHDLPSIKTPLGIGLNCIHITRRAISPGTSVLL
jgi:hypothetical protein